MQSYSTGDDVFDRNFYLVSRRTINVKNNNQMPVIRAGKKFYIERICQVWLD